MVNTRIVVVNRDYSVLRTVKFRVCLRRLASMSMLTIDAYFVRDTYRKAGSALTFASEYTTKMAKSGTGLCGRCQGPTKKSCDQNLCISKTSLFAAFGG